LPISVKQIQVTFDCAEPERVARFWCDVLGYVVPPPPEGFATWDDFDRALPPAHQGSAFPCIDPSARVAPFCCDVLGYVVPPPPEGFATWDDFDRALPPLHQGSAFSCIDPSA